MPGTVVQTEFSPQRHKEHKGAPRRKAFSAGEMAELLIEIRYDLIQLGMRETKVGTRDRVAGDDVSSGGAGEMMRAPLYPGGCQAPEQELTRSITFARDPRMRGTGGGE